MNLFLYVDENAIHCSRFFPLMLHSTGIRLKTKRNGNIFCHLHILLSRFDALQLCESRHPYEDATPLKAMLPFVTTQDMSTKLLVESKTSQVSECRH